MAQLVLIHDFGRAVLWLVALMSVAGPAVYGLLGINALVLAIAVGTGLACLLAIRSRADVKHQLELERRRIDGLITMITQIRNPRNSRLEVDRSSAQNLSKRWLATQLWPAVHRLVPGIGLGIVIAVVARMISDARAVRTELIPIGSFRIGSRCRRRLPAPGLR